MPGKKKMLGKAKPLENKIIREVVGQKANKNETVKPVDNGSSSSSSSSLAQQNLPQADVKGRAEFSHFDPLFRLPVHDMSAYNVIGDNSVDPRYLLGEKQLLAANNRGQRVFPGGTRDGIDYNNKTKTEDYKKNLTQFNDRFPRQPTEEDVVSAVSGDELLDEIMMGLSSGPDPYLYHAQKDKHGYGPHPEHNERYKVLKSGTYVVPKNIRDSMGNPDGYPNLAGSRNIVVSSDDMNSIVSRAFRSHAGGTPEIRSLHAVPSREAHQYWSEQPENTVDWHQHLAENFSPSTAVVRPIQNQSSNSSSSTTTSVPQPSFDPDAEDADVILAPQRKPAAQPKKEFKFGGWVHQSSQQVHPAVLEAYRMGYI